ncbi:DUF3131 domain-containing protein [Sulfitobacter sp. KE34]|uniref:DUF3131 domain-containing protein n=1 Tax=unclassified Sulfitobacter TaxID=196795 RepID=UPI0023E1D28E|nr:MULTISPECIES: DUF3131 domain-containing protein [unclassified Sulfitobacter]MDF3351839.1 DUF3131 domain-containing protein [Sulfitobacter sp. KE12]MDF3355511.1 DUF3131 domain-containing protein [Sulfitobacter sp. KE27]MDF3359159.1 DUF3131 domain-containing protein [Sulfitobacter sp. KE33]MDF3366583.1 DUF3131 domain-containing protein [Sulfitobacter sp. Ks34]MDF3370192.1 DUF3131 domain-containing protein [Sulfitobacter sp. Ks43]
MIARRSFLKWGTTTPLILSQLIGGAAAGVTAQNTLVVLDGFAPSIDHVRTAIVLDAFARKGLPVTCVVDPELNEEVSTVLKTRLKQFPGLVQVAPLVKELGSMTPYFQARAAYEAQRALKNALWKDEDAPSVVSNQTIACDMRDRPLAPSGVRAAGIRNVLMRPHTSSPVRPEAWQDGVVRILGGQRIKLVPAHKPYSFPQHQAVERVYYLSAQDFLALPLASLEPAVTAFALQVLNQPGDHWVSPILASDIQFRDAYSYKRNLGLHFVLKPKATAQDRKAVMAFQQELAADGKPSSFGLDTTLDPTSGYWISLREDHSSSGPVDVLRHSQQTLASPSRSILNAVYGVGARLVTGAEAGLSPQNILSLPAVPIREATALSGSLTTALGTRDCVLVISAELVQQKAHRALLKNALRMIGDDGISHFVALPDYVRKLIPTGPYIIHHRRTQAFKPQMSEPSGPQSEEARAQLLADAKVAWSYFEEWTNSKTGLCPATVNFASGHQRLHESVTMWDVGSHIFALMAAADLELISPEKFQSSIGRILPNLAGRRSQGRLLPQGWIATNKFKWGNRNFDGCDAGRLLSALYNLDTHPLVKDRAAPTVATWDLRDIVKDGIVYSVEDGQLETTFRSHCAHYAAWAFRTWGIEVASPYEVFHGRSLPDGQMALLEVCGHIGPLGAEPLLMEALEFGMSPESAYLADVLFAAQAEEYAETGQLVSVSETPINSPPWFLYQGLQFDASGRVWATDTVASLEAHRTQAFRDRHLSISSKSAYLWASYKDHPLCGRLLSLVRDKAQTPYGFAPSINKKTGDASRTYSDINTNAVILQAIAAMLKIEA